MRVNDVVYRYSSVVRTSFVVHLGSRIARHRAQLGSGEDLVGFGAAAACAWEFGDLDTHAQLMTWANTRYQPTAKDGEFYYQFGLDEPWPRGWPNDWLLMTVAGGQGSWHRLYNELTNLEGKERKVLQDGALFKEWKAIGEGEIEVTTTVDRHTFVIR